MPFGPYEDFEDCVNSNRDKDDPEAYCAALERQIRESEESATLPRMRLQIVPVVEDPAPSDLATDVEVKVEVTTGEEPLENDEDARSEDFHTMMVVEGVWTGDGRYIEEGALTWRNLPIPLMATDRTSEGHMNAVLVGNIERVERIGREIHAYGSFVNSEDDAATSLINLIRAGDLRGVSVDLDAMEYEAILPESAEPARDSDGNLIVEVESPRLRVTAARIMGATVVPFPAFQEAYIESLAVLTASLATLSDVSGYIERLQSFNDLDFSPPAAAREEAERGLRWRQEYGRGGTEVGVARARDIANGRNLSPDTIKRMVSYFARHEVDKEGEGWSPRDDGYPSAGRIAWALWGGDPGRAWAEKLKRQMDSREAQGSILASGHPIAAPVVPPASFFANPVLESPTPLTVTDEGRVFGHLAVWGQCHIGFADRCIEPPSSRASYAHFLTGEILCEDGSRLPVGQITLGAGHAAHRASAEAAAAHYDNVATAVADVTAGEDAYGIWVSGALRPDLSPATIRALMASDVSGDWRRIGGNLELVAILAVNVPGFPKVRVTERDGLVASLSISAFNGDDPEPASPNVERVVERIAESIGRSREQRIAELLDRVRQPEPVGGE